MKTVIKKTVNNGNMGRDSAVTQSACTTEENSWAMV